MGKQKKERREEPQIKPDKREGHASEGDSSRTQKGDPAQKGKGKAEGRK